MRNMMKRTVLQWRIAWLKCSEKKRRGILGGLVAVFLLGALTGALYAKYIKSQDRAATVSAKEFYFTSDYLRDKDEPIKTYKLNPGETSVTIALNNFADALRVSDLDINYTMTVKVNDEDLPAMKQTGTISASAEGTTESITIAGLDAGTRYVVTVTGEAGYVETLRAAFDVAAADAVVYMYVDDTDLDDNYVLLTVWTKNVSGEAEIGIPDGLIPDNTDPVMATATSGPSSFSDANSFAETYSSHTYRFFKEAGDDYSVANFKDNVKVNGIAAIAGTP